MKSLYAELAERLVAEIGTGKYEPGSALPSELVLSARYGVSRATVRSALDRVHELGLISRRKRGGNRVEATTPRMTFKQSISSIDDEIRLVGLTERRVQSLEEISASKFLSAKIGVAVGSRWLRVEQLRINPSKPDEPLCWTDVYLAASIGVGIKEELRNGPRLICELIEQHFEIVASEVRQEIRSVGISPRLAPQFAVPPESHALEITKHYVDQNGIVFEITVSTSPAERFTHTSHLRRVPCGSARPRHK